MKRKPKKRDKGQDSNGIKTFWNGHEWAWDSDVGMAIKASIGGYPAPHRIGLGGDQFPTMVQHELYNRVRDRILPTVKTIMQMEFSSFVRTYLFPVNIE